VKIVVAVVVAIECGGVNKIQRHSPIPFKHLSLWSLFVDPH
jgi:hypothetical protein